jgi:peptide-methionine (S)-S-oxide reductase
MNTLQVATFAGGCFWCTEAVFERVEGVSKVVSGYTGGAIKNPAYREICTGRTGHAEGIQIFYDESITTYTELLQIFFATHNPTTLNRQDNDVGTQYRSAIFYANKQQQQEAEAYIAFLTQENVYKAPIVTELSKLSVFYIADEEHQQYYSNHTSQGYCQVIINPKLQKLEQKFQHKLKVS